MKSLLLRAGAFAAVAVAVTAGCGNNLSDQDAADAGVGALAVQIVAPTAGTQFFTDTLASNGRLAAVVPVSIEASGAFASLVVETSGGIALGELDAAGTISTDVWELGSLELVVRAVDGEGRTLAESRVGIVVAEPALADCHAWLDIYGLEYTVAGDTPGVADPVTVVTPINGMPYRYVSNDAPREKFFMDCSLARSLAEAAPILRERGIVEVVDIGVYNYRCIGGGTPPDCPNGVSQHAYATAIDIAGVVDSNQVFYSVNDDWIIDPSSEDTCEAATDGDKDTLLHELICDLKSNRVWNIVLTPNYNSAHRNHFHVDLTPGGDFIRSGRSVDLGPDNH